MATQLTWIAEEDIASALSLPIEKIRAERPHLLAGECERRERGVIFWQKTAADRVAATLGVPWSAPEKKPAVPAAETVTVLRDVPNPHVIICKRANGQEIVVGGVTASKFTPIGLDGKPMTFQARPVPGASHWALVGNQPRWRGKF